MATNHLSLKRDLIGANLYIKDKKVIDSQQNIRARHITAQHVSINGPLTTDLGEPSVWGEETIFVGPTRGRKSIQEVIDKLKGKNAQAKVIKIDPGCYDEYITIEGMSSGVNSNDREYENNDKLVSVGTQGFQILGDMRPYIVCKSYVNGYENNSNSGRGSEYSITTSSPASGPYKAFIAESFGGIGGIGPVGAQVGNPLLGGSTLTNVGLTGQVALMSRGGGIGFATKALNAQNAGAAAAIIYNNNPNTGINTMGGTSGSVTIPAYSVSNADGLVLKTLITNNPGIQITISAVDPVYDPPLGTNYAMTQLSLNGSRDQITITMTGPLPVADDNILGTPSLVQPDFSHPKLELAIGDKFILADSDVINSNFANSIHTITGFSGNTITFTPPVPTVMAGGVDITLPGANITFLPNVCISPSYIPGVPARSVLSTAGIIGMGITGVWVDVHPSQPFANLTNAFRLTGQTLLVNNIVATDTQGVSANNWGMHVIDANTYIQDGYRGSAGRWASIGWSEGVGISSNAMLRSGSVFVSNCRQLGFAASIGTHVGLENLQVFGVIGLYQPDVATGISLGSGGNYSGVSLNVNKLLHVADIYGTGISVNVGSEVITNNPSVRVERCYFPANGTAYAGYGIYISKDSSMTINRGVFWSTGAYRSQPTLTTNVSDCYDVWGLPYTLPNVGIYVEGKFATDGNLTFSGNDLDYFTVGDAEFSAQNDPASPANVFSYTAAGPTQLNNVFTYQSIDYAGIAALELNPTTQFLVNYMYVGKTFTIVSKTAFAHTLTLTGGATFLDGTTVYNFPASAGKIVTFRVLSTSKVAILSQF